MNEKKANFVEKTTSERKAERREEKRKLWMTDIVKERMIECEKTLAAEGKRKRHGE